MKNYFTLFFFFLASLVYGQTTINIDGFVLDGNNAGVPDVTITILTDSTSGAGYFSQVLTDASGYFSDSFTLPANQTQGTITVIMENCPGTMDEVMYLPFNPASNNFTLAFLYCDGSMNCSVDIQSTQLPGAQVYELTGTPSGQAPFAFLWSNGATTPTITVAESGTYCLTIVDTNGCEAFDCEVILITPTDSCGVTIEQTPAGALSANAFGEAPWTYLWNTGDSAPVIFPNAPGDYCVTVIDATGCIATDCYFYSGSGDTSCLVFIEVITNGANQTVLEAVPNGQPPFAFLWNTGETSSSILPAQSGAYCVTMTDANGCSSTSCVSIQFPPADNYLVLGNVWLADSSNVTQESGLAYLITYDPGSGLLTAVDSVALIYSPAGLSYSFGDVPAGDYRVKIALDPASPSYASTMPTYYESQLFWNDAEVITVPYAGFEWFDVFLIEGVNPGGPGFVGGYVSNGANFWAGNPKEDLQFLNGAPMGNVSILLLDAFDQPVSHTVTDPNGHFGFDNLAWGTYQVIVEIPGIDQGIAWVTIGPDNPAPDNILFEVEENSITTEVQEVVQMVSVTTFPNPVVNTLQATIASQEQMTAQLELLNTQGQLLYSRSVGIAVGEQTYSVDMSNISNGVYLLRIQSAAGLAMQRIVKQ